MSTGLFLISLFLLWQLRKFLRISGNHPHWEKLLTGAMYGAIVLVLVELVFFRGSAIRWVWYGLMVFILAATYSRREFRPARSVLVAVLPFVFVSLFSDIFNSLYPEVYEAWRNHLEAAVFFSVIWLVGMWVVTNRQQKALAQERLLRQEEEERQRILAHRKVELEWQVEERTAELVKQKDELQRALAELKNTQTQLIQQEKLASLGELTAGIAHEIQNPLNFVNNFSEVSGELLEELKVELRESAQVSDGVGEILSDLALNLQKIQQHGKRADSIVKGMLQHSRSNAGEKKETDLNGLADEYLHLAYHGLRARDNTFNATLTTAFDPNLPKVEVIPQDLGRVLLNLFNNAFYATREKQKTAGPEFKPEVKVSTCQKNGRIEVRVRDNGNGIPKAVREKMFQPFFTTKPTGQGTGLGLSLTYEIITKGHGGEVEVDTKEGEYAEFIIRLPINNEM
jgi:two-component system, NtrC family, sensor kinase